MQYHVPTHRSGRDSEILRRDALPTGRLRPPATGCPASACTPTLRRSLQHSVSGPSLPRSPGSAGSLALLPWARHRALALIPAGPLAAARASCASEQQPGPWAWPRLCRVVRPACPEGMFKFNPAGASAPRKKPAKQRAGQGGGGQGGGGPQPADRTPSLSTSLPPAVSLLQNISPQTALGRSAQPRVAAGQPEGPAQSFFGGGPSSARSPSLSSARSPSLSSTLSLSEDGAVESRRVRRVSFGAPQVCNFSLSLSRARSVSYLRLDAGEGI